MDREGITKDSTCPHDSVPPPCYSLLCTFVRFPGQHAGQGDLFGPGRKIVNQIFSAPIQIDHACSALLPLMLSLSARLHRSKVQRMHASASFYPRRFSGDN